MKILVCISVVPDTTSKISLSSNNFVNLDGLTFITGPYEDYALSRAIELKESNADLIEVIIFHVGNDTSDSIIRKCLALGADSAVRVNSQANDAKQVAQEIAAYVKDNPVDLILMGKESIDFNTGLVHQITASLLGWEHFNPVMNLSITGNVCDIKVDGIKGIVNLSCSLPLVLGCQEPIAEWKIPSMRGIMAARTKNINVREALFENNLTFECHKVNDQKRKGIIYNREQLNELIDVIKKEVQS
jgi:electron transfer flavoprotein beta subunit